MTRGAALIATVLAACALAAASGCGSSSQVSDSKIASALDLKQTSDGYEMSGNPFCSVDQLLNDSGAVDSADKSKGSQEFVIASPNGDVGILARKPFAGACKRQAEDGLKRLSHQQSQ